MGEKRCPHCGHSLPGDATSCPCGFSFPAEAIEVPATASARTAAHQRGRPAVLAAVSARAEAPAPPRAEAPAPPRHEAVPRPNPIMLMPCPACGARISRRAHQCPKCGSPPYGHCQICAMRILVNDSPCPECGDPQPFGPE